MKKLFAVIGIAVIIFLCFLFNKYDLDISIFLTRYNSYFFEFFDDFGELPVYVGPILFGGIFFCLEKNNVYKAACLSISIVAYFIVSIKIIHNIGFILDYISILICFISSLILGGITVYCLSKVKKETLGKIKDIALLGLLVSIISVGCTEIIKNIWGRVRFRDLGVDYNEFTNLFSINGINGHKSFPSGHTNAGTSILLISLLVPRFTSKKWIKYLVTSFCFVYIATLAISRIVVSAHYASDVLFGFIVGFSTLCITYSILNRKGVINVASNKC